MRNPRGSSSLLQKPRLRQPKPKHGLKAEAYAILSYLRLDMLIPLGQVETRLRKMKGIKEVTINHVSSTLKIRYDPSVLTAEKIRSVLKKLGSRKQR